MSSFRVRRLVVVVVMLLIAAVPVSRSSIDSATLNDLLRVPASDAEVPSELANLAVKGRAPKTGYERSEFGNGWGSSGGCSTREIILQRDLRSIRLDEDCRALSGILQDPYTGTEIRFTRGPTTSDDVQIDHVVALSNAWQTGAQRLTYQRRVAFANDPLNLLAVSGEANEQKSDGDAATWLPANKSFRCQYVRRQIKVKAKYALWVTQPEQQAMARVLHSC